MTLEQKVNNMVPLAMSGRAAARTARLRQAALDKARAAFVIDLVALATGVPAAELRCETRSNARAARARQIAMYMAYVAWAWPLARIGEAFDRDRTTVGYACRLIEDMRDDPDFDARLERLETCLKAAPEPADVKLLSPNLVEMACQDGTA